MGLLLNPDYSDMLSAFSAEGVEYLVVGAYALATHAVPRATGDIDLWVRPTPANAQKVMAALRQFGAPLGELTEADLSTPGLMFQIGVAPRRIDILTAIDGVTFEEAWAGRFNVDMGTQSVPIIGRRELIKNKRATGRTKDLADVELLEGAD